MSTSTNHPVRILDQGRLRGTRTDYGLFLEELPRKPCKRQLHCVYVRVHDGYALPLDALDDGDLECVVRQVEVQLSSDPDAHWFMHRSEVSYLDVAPEGCGPLEAHGADFVLHASWTSYSAYSPDSDWNQPDPYYSEVCASSKAAGRKLYQLLQTDPDALSQVKWTDMGAWLDQRKIGRKYNHSVWH